MHHVAQQSMLGDDGLAAPIQPAQHWLREGWFNTDQTMEPQKMVNWHILDKTETFSEQKLSQDLCCRCTKTAICNFLMMTFNAWLKMTQAGTAPPEGKPLATLLTLVPKARLILKWESSMLWELCVSDVSFHIRRHPMKKTLC